MEENEIIERYIATILVGDEYHAAGETHIIASYELENTKKCGLRLRVKEGRDRTIYHLYPVSITKKVYRLDLIETSTIEGGDRKNPMLYKHGDVGVDYLEYNDHDWKDRWP